MEQVVDDLDQGALIAKFLLVSTIHIHRHCTKSSPALCTNVSKNGRTSSRPRPRPAQRTRLVGPVYNHSCVAMPLLDGELVHGDDFHAAEIDWPEFFLQVLSVDLLDRVPSHSQVVSDVLYRQHGTKPYDILGQPARDAGIGVGASQSSCSSFGPQPGQFTRHRGTIKIVRASRIAKSRTLRTATSCTASTSWRQLLQRLTRSGQGCNSTSITGWASPYSRSTSWRRTQTIRYPFQPPRAAVSSSLVNGGSPVYPTWLWLSTKQDNGLRRWPRSLNYLPGIPGRTFF